MPYSGMSSNSTTQRMIVWVDLSLNRLDTTGHRNAPSMPDEMAVIDSNPTIVVLRCNSVRAKRMAVLETVAMASDMRNHATRKIITSRSRTATLTVFHNDFHANATRLSQIFHRLLCPGVDDSNGGPGRLRSHRRASIVNENHHIPTRSSTHRRGIEADFLGKDVFERIRSRQILKICTKIAAQYPKPTPFDEI